MVIEGIKLSLIVLTFPNILLFVWFTRYHNNNKNIPKQSAFEVLSTCTIFEIKISSINFLFCDNSIKSPECTTMRLISKCGNHYIAPPRSWNFVKPHILQMLNFSMLKCFWGSFVDKGQISSNFSKQFWSLYLEKTPAIHPPSIEEGPEDIGCSRSVVLYIRKSILRSQQWLQFSYKTRQLLYYKMWQKFIARCVMFSITKYDHSFARCESY